MAIHLDLTSPPGSSSLPEGRTSSPCHTIACVACLLLGLAPDEACHAAAVTSGPVVSCTAVSPLPSRSRAVCSLLRLLSGHPGRTLSAIVLYGARKFLNRLTVKQTGRGHQEVSSARLYQMNWSPCRLRSDKRIICCWSSFARFATRLRIHAGTGL
jgi:hypothetical protein